MTVIKNVLVEVYNVVQRAELEARALNNGTPVPSTASSTLSPTSTSAPAATTTASSSSSGGPTSSPLLFFVALGFGVVFTNLWIIVGVKYCFRYNARNRALRQAEDGSPIDMQAMPRPHRRRREKKLMTMEEVNERFPMTKYKNWVASRQSEGLPSAGGVTAPPSRAGSIQEIDPADGKVSLDHAAETAAASRASHDEGRPATATTQHEDDSEITEIPTRTDSQSTLDKSDGKNPVVVTLPTLEEVKTTASTVDPKHAATVEDDDEEEEEDHIHTAVPPELLQNPGDSCAICIDTLEDDDDIRGLTCGHAFHAGCLDPWLTSRRACCPLCKADYYTPKPRPEGEPAEPERSARRAGSRRNLTQQQQSAWSGIRGTPIRGTRMVLPGRFMASPTYPGDGYGYPSDRNQRRADRAAHAERAQRARERIAAETGQGQANTNANQWHWRPRVSNPFANMRLPFGRNRGGETTPAQLEAGTGAPETTNTASPTTIHPAV